MLLILTHLTLGACAWPLLEYILHRWFHISRGRDPASAEHLAHHARPDRFAAWWKKAGFVAGLLLVLGWLSIPFASGLGLAYLAYETLHKLAHETAPRTRYGARVRERHFRHHFVDPNMSHGVSTGLFDILFRTTLPNDPIPVPRKMAYALPWLFDANGDVRPAFRDSYCVKGP
jgi:hypothetical protein